MRAVAALAVASTAVLLAAMTVALPDAPSQARETLTWRQAEILHVRARTHACTDTLGRPRFRVEQRIIVGGPPYRRWVLNLWRKRAAFYCKAAADYRRQTQVSGMWYEIAVCESGSRPPNWHINTGNGFFGGLQFLTSTWLAYGGGRFASRADLATPAQQVQVASGMSLTHWPVCGRPYR